MTVKSGISVASGGLEYARVAVRGRLESKILDQLRAQLGALVDDGARYLTLDLSRVSSCAPELADVLTWADLRAGEKQGWLALTGIKHLMHLAAR